MFKCFLQSQTLPLAIYLLAMYALLCVHVTCLVGLTFASIHHNINSYYFSDVKAVTYPHQGLFRQSFVCVSNLSFCHFSKTAGLIAQKLCCPLNGLPTGGLIMPHPHSFLLMQ